MIYVLSGSGAAGARLLVTSSGAGTITVSNTSLGKSYSKSAIAGGTVEFKGLQSGTWSITLSDGIQTTTQTITIDTDYSISVSYFSATISISYPAGSICTCTNGSTTLTAPNTSGTWECIIPSAGTWTVSCTDGTDTASQAVSITTEGQAVSVELIYIRYLYKNGTFDSECGNWVSLLRSTVEFNSDNFTITPSSSDFDNRSGFENAVDVTEYKSLRIDLEYTGRGYEVNEYFGLGDTRMAEFVGNSSMDAKATIPFPGKGTTVRKTFSVDISKLSGSKYIGIDGSQCIKTVYEIALLP